jgi:hypothetical protein
MVFGLGYQSMVFHFEIYNNGFDLSYITNGHFTYFVSQGLTLGSVRASPEINILISGNLKRHSTRLQALVFGKKYPLPISFLNMLVFYNIVVTQYVHQDVTLFL